jgi:predicted membrane-bound dolichyl-phosphate-mannose-protein mannosyltransferase
MTSAIRAADRVTALWAKVRELLAHPDAPVIVLGAVLVISLISRVWSIGAPCSNPCGSHTLIFDEAFYVNAARAIDHIHPTGVYAHVPLGVDPNAEHPQLAKLMIAVGIKLFGDGPWGWRLGSVIFGTLALLGMYGTVRGLGGSDWLAVGVTAVMASDNLFIVHGRIATLDIYALALMLAAAGAYVRRRPLLAGVLVGVAACMKETALIVLLVFTIYELLLRGGRPAGVWRRLGSCWAAALAATVAVLAVIDQIAVPFNPGNGARYHDPFSEISHIFSYGRELVAVAHATGISSTPWQWLLDQKPIPYAQVAANTLAGGKTIASHVLISFQGEVNPFIMFVAIPALVLAACRAWQGSRLDCFAVAWFLGTFLPYVFLSTFEHRITYLYYVLEVMPAIYLATARMFARAGPAVVTGWAIALVVGVIDLYPIR